MPFRADTWKAGVLLLLVALAGGAVGSVVTARTVERHRGPERSRHGSDWYIDLLEKELALSTAQRDSVRAVLARHRSAMDSIYAELRPRMEARREAIRADVRALLSTEQQGRYTALNARLDAERREKSKKDSTHR